MKKDEEKQPVKKATDKQSDAKKERVGEKPTVKNTDEKELEAGKKSRPEAHSKGDGHKHNDPKVEAHSEGDGHEHAHGGIFGANTELIFSLICGALLGTGFGLSYLEGIPSWVGIAIYVAGYFFGGFYTAKEAVQTIAKGGFEIDFLMLVAAIGAAVLPCTLR
eukprot:Opistho-1_new@66491